MHGFDLVIDGSGADTLWFTELFSQDALDLIELGLGGPMTGSGSPNPSATTYPSNT